MLKAKLIRYRIMDKHLRLAKSGEFGTAHALLKLLRTGVVHLGLNDDSTVVEQYLESIGLTPHYTRNYNIAVFHMPVDH